MPSVENFKAVWLPGLAQAQPVAALLVLLHAGQFPEEVVRAGFFDEQWNQPMAGLQ